MLTIGELARRAGVAPGALRCWEELGLLPAPARASGQRRHLESAVALAGIILRDVGFSLAEHKALVGLTWCRADEWRRLARPKLAEFDERIVNARAACEAIEHALRCPNQDILRCPQLRQPHHRPPSGHPLHDAHSH